MSPGHLLYSPLWINVEALPGLYQRYPKMALRDPNVSQFLKTCCACAAMCGKPDSKFVLGNLPATKSMCTLHRQRSHGREVIQQEWFVLYENINSQG